MQHNRFAQVSAVALCAALGLIAQPALSQTARSGGNTGGQSAQLMQQLQQLASERTAMQA